MNVSYFWFLKRLSAYLSIRSKFSRYTFNSFMHDFKFVWRNRLKMNLDMCMCVHACSHFVFLSLFHKKNSHVTLPHLKQSLGLALWCSRSNHCLWSVYPKSECSFDSWLLHFLIQLSACVNENVLGDDMCTWVPVTYVEDYE